MKVLYYDCFSGISGDMNLAAMIDLGIDKDYLICEIKKLNLSGYEIVVSNDERKGINGTKVEIKLIENSNHHHHHGNTHHHHRTLKDIRKILDNSNLSKKVKNISLDIFKKVATAEAKIHNREVENVGFHEVGAIDSIIDIVGAAICYDKFNVDKVISSPLELGSGMVKCAHGVFPVPAPATLDILKDIPVKSGNCSFETTTPTGAAIIATFADEYSITRNFTTKKIGYGIGHKDVDDIPNVLRVFIGETDYDNHNYSINEGILLECNIDDMNPELYDFVFEELLNNGADDVFLTPIIMKKSRPANKLSVLCNRGKTSGLKEIIFKNTTTIGIREFSFSKSFLQREFDVIQTKYGEIRIKKTYFGDEVLHEKPEYEDCKTLAKKNGVSINDIYKSLK